MVYLTLTISISTMVKTRRISRLEVVCKKNHFACATPAIELIYILEEHITLININFDTYFCNLHSKSLIVFGLCLVYVGFLTYFPQWFPIFVSWNFSFKA